MQGIHAHFKVTVLPTVQSPEHHSDTQMMLWRDVYARSQGFLSFWCNLLNVRRSKALVECAHQHAAKHCCLGDG